METLLFKNVVYPIPPRHLIALHTQLLEGLNTFYANFGTSDSADFTVCVCEGGGHPEYCLPVF